MGLRHDEATIERLWRGVTEMEESTFYQMIVGKGLAQGRTPGLTQGLTQGRGEEGRRLLMKLGERQFGRPPAARWLKRLNGVTELADLEELVLRVIDVGDWDELLPPRRRRPARS